ncbi:hypothetical protein N566_22010 [Streptomycetaceae bacterium MP113-05]|nr:hypothetical protein N566_22010 [Streptomycetaceae bacterium MP113-05]
MRRIAFQPQAWEDYTFWVETDRKTVRRINRLVTDILRDPFGGIGKPEPLKHSLAGAWSRRIDEEHRLVYLVTEKDVVVLQARFHY